MTQQTQKNEERKYYDQGWNARVRGEPFTSRATNDWIDGWRDCNEAPPEDRKEI